MLVRKKKISESPFKQRNSDAEQDAICNNWMSDLLAIFNNTHQSGYLNMRDAQEYLTGIYDLGHENGYSQRDGDNLINLIKESNEPE